MNHRAGTGVPQAPLWRIPKYSDQMVVPHAINGLTGAGQVVYCCFGIVWTWQQSRVVVGQSSSLAPSFTKLVLALGDGALVESIEAAMEYG